MSKRSARPAVLPRPVADVWSAGLGALAAARARGTDGFEALVARGRVVQYSGEHAAQEALDQVDRAAETVRHAGAGVAETVHGTVEAAVERVLTALGMPGRDEVAALQRQVDVLRQRIAAMDPRADVQADASAADAPAVFVVAPHPDGWAVRRAEAGRARSVHATKREAVSAGRAAARAAAPSRLTVRRADGSEGETVEYAAPEDAASA